MNIFVKLYTSHLKIAFRLIALRGDTCRTSNRFAPVLIPHHHHHHIFMTDYIIPAVVVKFEDSFKRVSFLMIASRSMARTVLQHADFKERQISYMRYMTFASTCCLGYSKRLKSNGMRLNWIDVMTEVFPQFIIIMQP